MCIKFECIIYYNAEEERVKRCLSDVKWLTCVMKWIPSMKKLLNGFGTGHVQ